MKMSEIKKTFHCGYDVEATLQKPNSYFEGMLRQGAKTLSPSEARQFFEKLKQHGKEIFCGCDNTDEKGYCKGHLEQDN